jgi:hypothetical protein
MKSGNWGICSGSRERRCGEGKSDHPVRNKKLQI